MRPVGDATRSYKSEFSLERDPATGRRNGKAYLKLSVTGSSLPPGVYELSAQLNQARGTRRITVAGPASSVSLTDEGQRTLTGTITFTVTVRDSRGVVVADGTPVTFEAEDHGVAHAGGDDRRYDYDRGDCIEQFLRGEHRASDCARLQRRRMRAVDLRRWRRSAAGLWRRVVAVAPAAVVAVVVAAVAPAVVAAVAPAVVVAGRLW